MGVPKLAKHYAQIAAAAAKSLLPGVIALADGHIMVGSAAGAAEDVAMSGDVTIDNTGATVIGDDKVGADELNSSDDFLVGTLEAAGVIKGLPIQTKDAHHTGVALADLTAAFGAPATLPNGSLYTYKNDTDAKIYLVAVVGSVFQIAEMTHVTA